MKINSSSLLQLVIFCSKQKTLVDTKETEPLQEKHHATETADAEPEMLRNDCQDATQPEILNEVQRKEPCTTAQEKQKESRDGDELALGTLWQRVAKLDSDVEVERRRQDELEMTLKNLQRAKYAIEGEMSSCNDELEKESLQLKIEREFHRKISRQLQARREEERKIWRERQELRDKVDEMKDLLRRLGEENVILARYILKKKTKKVS